MNKNYLLTTILCVAFPFMFTQCKETASEEITSYKMSANPYLPLWEHLPDGEPRVFEDPDNPGKFRIYIIGSHDVRFRDYCGPDIRMWSAPVEDLNDWRDEGPIFTYNVENQWDVMFAPDLVEVKENGKKVYYLYSHSRGWRREAMVCKGERPDGPFTPLNLNENGTSTIDGSILGFDPSVIIDEITDPKDPDFETGFRAYGFWGFQRSSAAELDPKTMYSIRPGTEIIPYFIPASFRYGVVRDPEGTKYPALYSEQDPKLFNFFEASSIRKVGNKYVMVFSGYSGPDYGMGSTNSSLRYAYGDSPLGPWRSGGVLVDSRGIVPNKDGSALMETNAAHNTHGSLQQINNQWYVFYHRPPRGFGFARQAMVAPVTIKADSKSVADGGKVEIYGYNPDSKGNIWTAKASNGDEYTGAEVTSEGFNIFGLDPYQYYSAGYACFMTNNRSLQDTWDIWDNSMDMAFVENGDVIGFKYFGFGGLKKHTKGIKPFAGTAKGNNTQFNAFLTPTTNAEFKINVMIDGPWDNEVWKGKKIAEIHVPAGSPFELTKFTVNVADAVDELKGKHAIYLVAEGPQTKLFDLKGIGFSCDSKPIECHIAPKISIQVGGVELEVPTIPVRSTNQNGYVDNSHYSVECKLVKGQDNIVTASSTNPAVKFAITQSPAQEGIAIVRADYNGVEKFYEVVIKK